MKTRLCSVLLLLFIATTLLAVDTAFFANLGFSEDGTVFSFAQYGIVQDQLFSDIFFVDVARNDFYPDALRSAVYPVKPTTGQNGVSALYTLLRETQGLMQKYHINHLYQGRPIYLAVGMDDDQALLQFRDFERLKDYTVQLRQTRQVVNSAIEAEFSIALRIQDERTLQDSTYIVGLPSYYRRDVAEYKIRQITLSPDESALVFVIVKIYDTNEGQYIRYMVETVSVQ